MGVAVKVSQRLVSSLNARRGMEENATKNPKRSQVEFQHPTADPNLYRWTYRYTCAYIYTYSHIHI